MALPIVLNVCALKYVAMIGAYRNRFDWSGECSERGISAEEFFALKASENGFLTKKASKDDDMFKKIDFYFKKNPEFCEKGENDIIYTCDVKAMKKINRNDISVQDEWTWIELHGVNEGNKGWLYGGKSDFIAFETRRGFLIVPRFFLIEKVAELVNFNAWVRTPEEAPYKIYQRPGRLDEITLIEKKYLLDIIWEEWT